ncbi:MAG: hypothetical protein H6983_17390 [Ectothiorhodospiraceae bacterium]|nr:hypothetical protein [Ectothiorhodospiraceae bacterium]
MIANSRLRQGWTGLVLALGLALGATSGALAQDAPGREAVYDLTADASEVLAPEAAVFARYLDGIRGGLKGKDALTVRLREALGQPGAAEIVYLSWVLPVTYPHPLLTPVGALVERGRAGRLVVSESKRSAARALAEQASGLDKLSGAVHGKLAELAPRVDTFDPLHREIAALFASPDYASVITLTVGAQVSKQGAEEMARHTLRSIVALFDERGGKLRLKPKNDTKKIAAAAADARRLMLGVDIAAARARAVEAAGDFDDAGGRDFVTWLRSRAALAALVVGTANTPLDKRFLQSSGFGTGLLSPDRGGWAVNPGRQALMVANVAFLERVLALRAARDAVERQASIAVRLAALAKVASAQGWDAAAGGAAPEPVEAPSPARASRGAPAAAPPAAVRASDEKPIELALDKVRFERGRTYLLESSAFYNPRTETGRNVYTNEFPRHYAARLFGVFDQPVLQSRDRRDLEQRLVSRNQWIAGLGETHEKILIYVTATPRWLSSNKNDKVRSGVPLYTMYPPSDYREWRDLVRRTVEVGRTTGARERYYEVWNEPETFWAAGNDAYLELYEQTARAIREADPQAKIGGAAINGWERVAGGEKGGTPLNIALLRHAARTGAPLDFVSWHHFSRPVGDLAKARDAYLAEAAKVGIKSIELVVSEWSPAGKNTDLEAVSFAETMLGLYDAGVSFHTVAAWEEFASVPRPGQPGGWGMITQQGTRKPMFHVHAFFDRVGRGSLGVARLPDDDPKVRGLVSSRGDGVYDLIAWEFGYEPPMRAALEVLARRGLKEADFKPYVSQSLLEQAIVEAKPLDRRHADAFEAAREAYRARAGERNVIALRFPGTRGVEILEHEVVGPSGLVKRTVTGAGDRLVAEVSPNEVVRVRFRAR